MMAHSGHVHYVFPMGELVLMSKERQVDLSLIVYTMIVIPVLIGAADRSMSRD